MVAYIGANGAGKSTTIKMMTGILTPTSGEVLIDGLKPYDSKKRKEVLKKSVLSLDNEHNFGGICLF